MEKPLTQSLVENGHSVTVISSKAGRQEETVEKIKVKYPNSTVEPLDVVESDIPHLIPETLQAVFTPEAHQIDELKQVLQLSGNLLKQLFKSDILVIKASLINLTTHSSLKA